MGEGQRKWVVAAGVAIAVALVWFAVASLPDVPPVRPIEPPSPLAVPATPAQPATPTTPTAVAATATMIALAPATSAPRRVLLASDPDPIPPVQYPVGDPEARDPFSEKAKDPIRTLVTVGAIRIGVPASATLRDEKHAVAIFTDLARALDTKEKGRKDDYETRAHEYQGLLTDYATRLQPYMSGPFAFHADGWILYKTVPETHATP